MELQKLQKAQTLHIDFLVPAAKQRTQLARQHLGVAAGDNNVRMFLSPEAPYRSLPAVYILYLIYQDIIMTVGIPSFLNVCAQLIAVGQEAELALFLIDIDDVGIGLTLMPPDEILQDIALTDAPLTDNDNDILLAQPGVNLLCILLSCDNVHNP